MITDSEGVQQPQAYGFKPVDVRAKDSTRASGGVAGSGAVFVGPPGSKGSDT